MCSTQHFIFLSTDLLTFIYNMLDTRFDFTKTGKVWKMDARERYGLGIILEY